MATLSPKLREEAFFVFKKQARKDLCWVKGCQNATKTENHSLCAKHEMQRYRSLNREKGLYASIRDHAKTRGIKFTITYDYFEGLIDAYCFHKHDPKNHGDKLTLDRVDPTKGYERKNLQILTLSENIIKGNRERWLPDHVRHMLEDRRKKVQTTLEEEEKPECPF